MTTRPKRANVTGEEILRTIGNTPAHKLDGLRKSPPRNRAERRATAKEAHRYPPTLYQTAQLQDGLIGYYGDALRVDDCFRAAIATTLQVPVEQVPDPRLHDRMIAGDDHEEIDADAWRKIYRWLDGQGLQIVRHDILPVERERWIGICVMPALDHPFSDHCLVMSYDCVLFNPAMSPGRRALHHGVRVREGRLEDVTYGFTFDRKGES